jgi:hypothetical protein
LFLAIDGISKLAEFLGQEWKTLSGLEAREVHGQ